MLVPLAVVTVTATDPVPAGAIAMILVALSTLNDADVVRNLTNVAPVKPVPLIMTVCPPALGP
ncbi:hypothetical protein GCM10017771_72060 [Streptomyces capitiformicae]|uniref:Uncharacterized protein n=1 Tax=Streptomyces capitiformicae TaxID=2014920 RepID=A0A918ZHM3_9ACTN|nr:hypothetical protein GCM10017771_72060 [Streptomyces capitiformicae]